MTGAANGAVADGPPLSAERQRLLEMLRRSAATSTPATPDEAPGLRVSLFFFSANLDDRPRDKYALVLRCAELADQLGLHAIWVPERHFDPFGAPYPAPAVLLAALAARTSRIGLRAGSVVLPLHDPVLVAEEWGVLDAVSEGRMGLSLASGWHADDFILRPDNYDDRKRVLESHLDLVRRLWRGEAIECLGPGGRRTETRAYPTPESSIPLWLTSAGNAATWERAGQLGLNVLTAMLEQTVDDIASKVQVYRAARAAARITDEPQVTCMLHTHLAKDAEGVLDRVREPLTHYLSAHLDLFTKFAAGQDIGVRPDEVSDADRAALIEHGLQRYVRTAGLFGDVDSCQPMLQRLVNAGVTELGCLVDFGLDDEHVVECVEQLGELRSRLLEHPVRPATEATARSGR